MKVIDGRGVFFAKITPQRGRIVRVPLDADSESESMAMGRIHANQQEHLRSLLKAA